MELQYEIMQRVNGYFYRGCQTQREAKDMIINDVVFCLDISKDVLFSRKNTIPYPSARRVITYVLRKELGMTNLMIGEMFGRDDATMSCNYQWIEKRLDSLKFHKYEDKAMKYLSSGFVKR